MSQHGRRHDRTTSRVTLPFTALGIGLVLLAALVAGVGAGTAVGAPSPDRGATADVESASPCVATAKACARLSTNEAWVTDGAGKVLRGPVAMNHGSPKAPTPTGTFAVTRKTRHHVSQESGVPMPYSVFFDMQGRAFHQGDPERRSVGCVRMNEDDARFLFENLTIGDRVQIVP